MSRKTESTEAWVKRVNDQARRIVERQQSMHPSAWAEALRPDVERYIELASPASSWEEMG